VASGLALVLCGSLAIGQSAGATALLDVARRAKAAGDEKTVVLAMRGWATIADLTTLPKGLEAEADRALAFAKDKGRLQLFATKLTDRLHVGFRDPAEVVGRVDVFLEKSGERTRLRRLEDEDVDRFEYALDPKLAEGGTIAVEAIATRFGREILLRRITLSQDAESALPSAPDIKVLEKHIAPKRVEVKAQPRDDGPSMPWWLIAGGAIAVALLGAAIWQETR
jgi:hypothetical protein